MPDRRRLDTALRGARAGVWLGSCCLLGACAGGGTGGGSGDAGAASSPLCDTDFSRLEGAAAVSFEADVMPMFGLMCAQSMCHAGTTPRAELYLGVRCRYDPEARSCTFPSVAPADPLSNEPQPLTRTVVDAVYESLMRPSTVAPAVRRVAPGDPGASFLVDKIAGRHNDRGYDCTSPSAELPPMPCGSPMPFGTPGLCVLSETSQARFDVIATWIAQGAKND